MLSKTMTVAVSQPAPLAQRLRTHAWSVVRHGVATIALCLLIATMLALLGLGPWTQQFHYSLSIGLVSWLVIDLGRLLWSTDLEVPWPAGWRGPVLVCLGAAAGWGVGGTLSGLWGERLPALGTATLLLTLVISVVASALFYQRSQARLLQARMLQAERDAAEAQLKLLQVQLDPHMLFNTLANLRVLVASDPVRATAMLDHLVDYLRATLGAARVVMHPLQEEFDRLRDYLSLMQVRMGDRLRVSLQLPAPLARLPVPALLLQPLVENSLRHGLEPQVAGGEVQVWARTQTAPDGSTWLLLGVDDTGVGLVEADVVPSAATGSRHFGTAQVRERLAAAYGGAASFTLQARPGGGTCAMVRLPCPEMTDAAGPDR